MENKSGNKRQYQTISESSNRESQLYEKAKVAETPESCGRQLRGWAKAFTLIELLVVVLIIGILAAVAVPQYQAAADLARVKRMLPVLRHIKDAEEVYKLTNGRYTLNFEELGIELPGTLAASKQDLSIGNTIYSLSSSGTYWHGTAYDFKGTGVNIYLSFDNLLWLCYPRGTERGRKICKSLGCADVSGDYCSLSNAMK